MKSESYLTHHEELRLDYLQKNIHFLNDREKQELAYLQYKEEGYTVPKEMVYRQTKLTGRSQQKAREEASLASYQEEYEESVDEDDLPDYPRADRSRRARTKKVVTPKEPKAPRPKKPRKKGRFKRFLKFLLLFLLAIIAGMAYMFYKGYREAEDQKSPEAKAAQTEVFNGEDTEDGVNILILGTDGRLGETSDMTRTDSIMVLNINNKDNKVKLVSFMRDTLINIDGNDYKLNLSYTFGEQNNHQGAENVREVLKDNFDISIKHYALVDFSTFATAIDTLFPEGVTIDAQFSTIDGVTVDAVDVPDDLNMKDGVVPEQTIKVGKQKMDGRTLLNYARFRKDDEGDYGRTRRQQQVLGAVLSQIKDPTKLFTGSAAIGKVFSMTSTSVPYSFVLTNGIGAALDGANGVEHTTIPENGDWVEEYDVYGGAGLKIDFEKYKERLSEMGFR